MKLLTLDVMAFKSLIIAGLGLIVFFSCKKNTVAEIIPDEPDLPAYVIKSAIHTSSPLVNYKYLYTFNAKAQVTERQYFFPATATANPSSITYSYDAKGKLISSNSTSPGNPNIYSEEFIYDSEDRLITRKNFINGNPAGTSDYTYNGNIIIEEYAGQVKYTFTLNSAGNIIKNTAEYTNDPSQNYIEEWLDYDDKPMINDAPPAAGSVRSVNNFHKSKLSFTDWQQQAYNKTYNYEYMFNADGYAMESKQYDAVTGALLWTITYELIKP